jgi:PTH1 family peptidyl-tRNA hydrolase
MRFWNVVQDQFKSGEMSDRYIIVGLGNPGPQYKKNRHNVGFQIVDYLAERHGLEDKANKHKCLIAGGMIQDRQAILAKPMTFMNRSGGPVGQLVRFFKVPLNRLLIVVDDIDLPTGTLRIRAEGGSAGQNGMKDIISHLKSESFPRLRVGIGRPLGRMNPAAYVLQDFKEPEIPIIIESYDRAARAIETWLQDGIELAMSRFNGPVQENQA